MGPAVAVDVQVAPVALGEHREGGLLTGDRGGDGLVGSIHRHMNPHPRSPFALVPVMPPARFA
jgi:hypothetical protein